MLDLKNLGVVELNAQEIIEVEGGFWFELLVLGIGILVGLLITKDN
jgi:hypothetical protein